MRREMMEVHSGLMGKGAGAKNHKKTKMGTGMEVAAFIVEKEAVPTTDV